MKALKITLALSVLCLSFVTMSPKNETNSIEGIEQNNNVINVTAFTEIKKKAKPSIS